MTIATRSPLAVAAKADGPKGLEKSRARRAGNSRAAVAPPREAAGRDRQADFKRANEYFPIAGSTALSQQRIQSRHLPAADAIQRQGRPRSGSAYPMARRYPSSRPSDAKSDRH